MTAVPTEADYFADDDIGYGAAAQLRRARRPAERAALLRALGDVDWRRAGLHTAVFGLDPDDDGCPQEEWLADSARLLWILSEAEHCRGERRRTGWPTPSAEYIDRLDSRTVELQHAVDHLLDEYVAGARRRRLVRAMCRTWGGLTRGQAVESAWCGGLRMPWWVR